MTASLQSPTATPSLRPVIHPSSDAAWNAKDNTVAILYHPQAEALALRYGIFLCPMSKLIRPVRFMAFYANQAIRHLFEVEGEPLLNCTLSNLTELGALREYFQLNEGERYRFFHLTLRRTLPPIVNNLVSDKTGRAKHFTYGQVRYVSYESLQQARTTSELKPAEFGPKRTPIDFTYINTLQAKSLPVPAMEAARLTELHEMDILDTGAEEEFDNLTRLAAAVCGTPIALVSLVDADRQWFKSNVGLAATETSREVSFCQHTIMGQEVFEVPNATENPIFSNNPLVTGDPSIRFYAGAPLTSSAGNNLGSLCVISPQAKELTPEQKTLLQGLAREVTARMELRRQNKRLEATNQALELSLTELRDAQQQLEEVNQDTTESLTYAARMQQAVLPKKEDLSKLFPASFIIHQPKNMVSGDFYWVHERRNKSFVVAADCTGHGVPGAFMSLIGINLLNKLVEDRGVTEPGSLLDELDFEIKRALGQHQASENNRDGMDIAVCVIDKERMQLNYASAFRTLFLLRSGEVMELKGERSFVGGGYQEKKHSFTTNTLALQPGDHLYLFTDGFTDQFGGERLQKFGSKRFRDLLKDTAPFEPAQQREMLLQQLGTWRADTDQTDDVLVMGVRI